MAAANGRGETGGATRRGVVAAGLGALALGLAGPGSPARAVAAEMAGAEAGLDPGLLVRAGRRAEGLDQLHALVVARRGAVALAEAYRGPAVDRPVNVKSVSKTIVATLTGIAIERGVLPGVEAPFAEVAPDLVPADADRRVGDITIADLLTMQAGLERTSGANYGAWVASGDWVAHALTRPFVAEPGARMQYSTGSYHLLGAALAHASGRSLLALARDWLGDPLGVVVPPWTRDPQGFYMGGNNMALSPMALYRFGETWRTGGTFEGRRVIPRDWIDASWTARTRSPWSGDDYGYGWFLTRIGGQEAAYARGYGGQMLFVVPALELVVAITSDPTRPARSGGHVGDLRDLVARDIIPAAERA
ncbi:MAG: serine hydrolase [Azospirillaceae bacterium]